MKLVVAGVGNILRSDDGFGVVVAWRLLDHKLPEGVRVVETGIGGMALVQELQDGADALIVVDAVDRGKPAGTVMVIRPEVPDIDSLTDIERYDMLADVHLGTPERVLAMAKALGVLPSDVLMVGCQPADAETFARGLSEPVARAVEVAVEQILLRVEELCDKPPGRDHTTAGGAKRVGSFA